MFFNHSFIISNQYNFYIIVIKYKALRKKI